VRKHVVPPFFMKSLREITALEVNGEHLSLAEVLRSANCRGQLGFLEAVVDLLLIRQEAAERGIEASDDELQQTADEFRVARDLHQAEALKEWLAANHLTFAGWERLLEDEVITRKLRDTLTDHQVEQYFAENKLSFDAATISQLTVGNEEVAKELRVQICEEGADFHKLARSYSIDAATRPASGYVGRVKRQGLADELSASVFRAKAGRIIGPLKTDQGWQLIRVHELHLATLDEATCEQIKTLLFGAWLSRQRSKAQISMPLLETTEEIEDEEMSLIVSRGEV